MKLACLSCGAVNRLPAERVGLGPKCGTCGAPLADGRVAAIDLAALDRSLRHDGLPLVVDFWAAWCGPCRMMAPEVEKAAAALAGRVRFAKLDTEACPEAGARFAIRGIPLLIAFAGGRERARQAGAQPAAAIARWAEGAAAAAAT
jgi:thioredoxin 2